jgi:beta-galactosidase
MNADNMLSFDVKGDARIVAVSNGNLASDEPMTGNMRRLYNGSALLIIRAGRTPGKITVKTSSDAFKTVNLVLRTDNRKTR